MELRLPLEVGAQRRPAVMRLLSLVSVAITVGMTAWASGAVTRATEQIAAVWIANGLLFAALLVWPGGSRRWLEPLLAGFIGYLLAGLVLGNTLSVALGLAFCDILEVVLAATMLQMRLGSRLDLARPRHLAWFGVLAVFAAPLPGAIIAGAVLWMTGGASSFEGAAVLWWLSDALGMAIAAPTAMAAFHRPGSIVHMAVSHSWLKKTAILTLVLIATVAVFAQSSLPLLFLAIPPLLVAALRLGPNGTAAAVALVYAVAIGFTVLGHGPLILIQHDPGLVKRVVVLQLFLLSASVTALTTAALVARRVRLEAVTRAVAQRARAQAVLLRTVLAAMEQGLAAFDGDGHLLAANHQYAALVGLPEDMVTRGRHYLEFARYVEGQGHYGPGDPEEQALERYQANLAGKPHYYLRNDTDGRSIEVMGRPLAGGGFVNVFTDVTERQAAVERLRLAHERMAALALEDGLTGLANRRALDDALDGQWRLAARDNTSLSILLLDADQFKSYNDLNGHRAGDDCLRSLAVVITKEARRPGDLAARYGGEEFAILLPETDAPAAIRLAERVCLAVRACQMPHRGNMPFGIVTVSLGVATARPATIFDSDVRTGLEALISAADAALYSAKDQGRNCVVASTTLTQADLLDTGPLLPRA